MIDFFHPRDHTLSAPARRMFVVTPHATNPISPLPKGLRFNAAGNVVLRAVDSDADVTITVAAGEIIPVRVSHVRVAGTTVAAGSIHAFS
ncbi:MAG: hypothetical protein ACK4IS_13375 [Erythrobacter sp.]